MFEKSVKLLLVEDEKDFANMLRQYMEINGLHVTVAADGVEGLETFRNGVFDICVLDVMMPGMDGFDLGIEIRKLRSDIPLIYLTAKSRKEDRIKGLRMGADDYVVKPFDADELLLRIRNILQRSGAVVEREVVDIGSYRLYTRECRLEREGSVRQLTDKESTLLAYMGNKQGVLLSRAAILEDLWGEDDYFLGRSMDVFISRLRKYVSEDSSVSIENIRGKGFILKVNT